MTDLPLSRVNVALGYIADAGLKVDTLDELLDNDPAQFSPADAHRAAELTSAALEDIVSWARQINRAISNVEGVLVDDFPID